MIAGADGIWRRTRLIEWGPTKGERVADGECAVAGCRHRADGLATPYCRPHRRTFAETPSAWGFRPAPLIQRAQP